MSAWADLPSAAVVMFEEPMPTAVTSPSASTMATVSSLELQAITRSGSAMPEASLARAEKLLVRPCSRVKCGGATSTVATETPFAPKTPRLLTLPDTVWASVSTEGFSTVDQLAPTARKSRTSFSRTPREGWKDRR